MTRSGVPWAVSAFALVLVATTTHAQNASTRAVSGVVRDAGHAPLAGATVCVPGTPIQAQTAADGSFTLKGVAAAEVQIAVEAPDQPPTRVTVPVGKARVAITLGSTAPAPATPPPAATTRVIRGKVFATTYGQPLAAAQVQRSDGTVVFTEPDGTFVLDGAPLTPVQIEVTAPEYEPQILGVATAQSEVEVTLSLAKHEQIITHCALRMIAKYPPRNLIGMNVIDAIIAAAAR